MELIQPSLTYKKSFEEAIEELRAIGDDLSFLKEIGSPKSIKEYIRIRKDHMKGKNLPSDWIPASTFWLVDKGEFIGEGHLRHFLTDQLRKEGGHIGYNVRPSRRQQGYGTQMLRLLLVKAREMGIEKTLVTCDETNVASRKIIEANGGVLERAENLGEGKPLKLLFWIELKKKNL